MGKWHLSSLVRVLDFERKLFSRNLPLDLIRNGQMWYRQREKSDWTVSFGTKYIAFHNLVLCGRCICHCIGMCAYNAAAATKISSRYIYIFFLLRSMCTFSALSFSIFRHSLNGCITFSAVFCVSQIELSFCLYLHLRPSNRQNHHINRLWCDNMTKGKMKRRNVIECWTCAKILAHLSWSRVYEPQFFCKQILTIFFIACSLILILNAYSPSWTWI